MTDSEPQVDPGAIARRLDAVRARITEAEQAAGRSPGSVTLVAVGKTFGADALRAAADAGMRDFGENYLQEAVDKQAALADLPLTWHFIGAVQSNKTRTLAEHFDWVHTVDREKIARRLSDARPEDRPPLSICVQVNMDGEATKAGVAPDEVAELVGRIAALPRIVVRGLMAIPAPRDDIAEQRAVFDRVADLARSVVASLPAEQVESFDTLSMGMSGDLEAAVEAGATQVRIGSAIFGARTPRGDRLPGSDATSDTGTGTSRGETA